jgi:hypothetical protein
MLPACSQQHLALAGDVLGTLKVSIEAVMALFAFKQALVLAVCFGNVEGGSILGRTSS